MKNHTSPDHGFSLVEVTLALGVVSFALTAIFGLLPVGLMLSRGAVEQTAANGILSEVVADLRATPSAVTQSARFAIAIPAAVTTGSPEKVLYFDGEGQPSVSLKPDSRYRLGIEFLQSDHANAPARAALRLAWPAVADPANASGAVKTVAVFSRNR